MKYNTKISLNYFKECMIITSIIFLVISVMLASIGLIVVMIEVEAIISLLAYVFTLTVGVFFCYGVDWSYCDFDISEDI